jgi:hypothetical protein
VLTPESLTVEVPLCDRVHTYWVMAAVDRVTPGRDDSA